MRDKMIGSLREALKAMGLADGMILSFHHHLRNGDAVLNGTLDAASSLGISGLTVAASSIFPVHAPLVEHIRRGTVSRLEVNYMSGPVADFVSRGGMMEPVIFRTHGGRPRAIESGELPIDIAVVAAPSADGRGNLTGTKGPSACGSLGYAMADARCAKRVLAVTDNPVDRVAPASIDQSLVDAVVTVDSIGDPAGIVSGTTRMPRDPVALVMARYAAMAIKASGLLADGVSFQTGAGGASLAAASYLRDMMRDLGVVGSFGMGGITSHMVRFLREGLVKRLYDVQCFDLEAVKSIAEDERHVEVSASLYASPGTKGPLVDDLDVVILGATEIDLDFNVNVHTDSSGRIIGGSGGHSDTAAGAKLAVVVAPLVRSRLPIVVDRVTTVSTPGDTVDLLVTERGMAVNPARPELRETLDRAGLPVMSIGELREIALSITGIPRTYRPKGRTVGIVEYRDGRVIDRISEVS